ncbi:zinc ribbon domain-containing protein [Mycoplasmatota bacterium]|nr:zinc ribbon domain-containing protein [Mycoplasmatota bacterium]
MPYCSNCGKEVDRIQAVCLNCGVSTKQIRTGKDNGGFLWGLLGFLVPVAGLVIYLLWMDQKPKTAKAAGIGALISAILGVFIMIIYIIFVFILISGGLLFQM